MTLAMTLRPLEELEVQHGPMRLIDHHAARSFAVLREQREAYAFNIAGGRKLRESVITGADGNADLIIRAVEYIEPVTLTIRYAVDYWSIRAYWTADHNMCTVAEAAYEEAVRGEFARPTLTLDRDRFTRGLASFYDVTDVI
ncbi:hypothetical protein [Streptomyces similanensis]|uniref:Uncharacterized protein n=1 Tax=Streptomyces similanensis TaxID=1274988 RepID=A0ABP9L8Y0_9ACTN